jgi:hypothetical protein
MQIPKFNILRPMRVEFRRAWGIFILPPPLGEIWEHEQKYATIPFELIFIKIKYYGVNRLKCIST